jgi:hypothetical protein
MLYLVDVLYLCLQAEGMRVQKDSKKSCLFTRASSSGNTSFVMQVKVFHESELCDMCLL